MHDDASYSHLDDCHIMFDKAEVRGEGKTHDIVYQIHGKNGEGDYEDPDQEIAYGAKDYEVPVSSKDVFNHNVYP